MAVRFAKEYHLRADGSRASRQYASGVPRYSERHSCTEHLQECARCARCTPKALESLPGCETPLDSELALSKIKCDWVTETAFLKHALGSRI